MGKASSPFNPFRDGEDARDGRNAFGEDGVAGLREGVSRVDGDDILGSCCFKQDPLSLKLKS